MPRPPVQPTPDRWRQLILDYIAQHPDRPQKPRGLARALDIAEDQYPAFRELTHALLADGALALGRGRTLTRPAGRPPLVGVFRRHRQGFGFVTLPGEPDLYIPRTAAGDALDGDVVAVRRVPPRAGEDRTQGQILRVVERSPQRWVGVLQRVGRTWGVRPQGKAHAPLVTINDPTAKSTRPGDLVVVEPLGRVQDADVVPGVIVERLGPPSTTQVRILGVIRRFGIPDQFTPQVRAAAAAAVERFDPQAAAAEREDLSGLLTFTIDPADARDFDDAISIEPLAGGRTRLGVHIADVAHFVQPGDALDVEARARGNSVYFPGYVVPMLPEVLSNGVCSLQPEQPRFTKSAFITYDGQARVVETRFANSLIRSHARLTYEEASAALAGQPGDIAAPVLTALKHAERLARAIQRRRIAAGMITLALPEVQIRLGPDGEVIDAAPADTSFSHTLIEMFMVEANEAVCRRLTAADVPHLRRVHPPPDEDAGSALARLAMATLADLPRTLERAEMQQLLRSVRGQPAEFAVNYTLLRALAQAVYAPGQEGHYALASDAYAHFTSPIRRYPDLVVHRALDRLLRDARPSRRRRDERAAGDADAEADLAVLGAHVSALERRAQQAEREARQLLLLELMKKHLGDAFDGVITSVNPFGAFVQLRPYLAEGLVHLDDFGLHDWRFHQARAAFVAPARRRIVVIGQRVRVVVAGVDDVALELSLRPADPRAFGAELTPRQESLLESAGRQRGPGRRSRAEAGARSRATGRSAGRAGDQQGGRRKPPQRGRRRGRDRG